MDKTLRYYRQGLQFRNISKKVPVLESFFSKVAGLQGCKFIKKRLQHRCLPVIIAEDLRTPFLKNFCERLVLMKLSS